MLAGKVDYTNKRVDEEVRRAANSGRGGRGSYNNGTDRGGAIAGATNTSTITDTNTTGGRGCGGKTRYNPERFAECIAKNLCLIWEEEGHKSFDCSKNTAASDRAARLAHLYSRYGQQSSSGGSTTPANDSASTRDSSSNNAELDQETQAIQDKSPS